MIESLNQWIDEQMNQSIKSEQLKERTKRFAVEIVNLFRALSRSDEARILGKQLLRSGTSVAANYRAVCRARSKAEFISKMGIVVEESDETVFWLEVLTETKIVEEKKVEKIKAEANELLAIFASSFHTAKYGKNGSIKNESMKK